MALSMARNAEIERHVETFRQAVNKNSRSLLDAFHHADRDNSQQLTSDEFATCLKECGVVVPPQILFAIISRFDANKDGTVSIPEFKAFMMGDKDTMEMLAEAPKTIEGEAGQVGANWVPPAMRQSAASLEKERYMANQMSFVQGGGGKAARQALADETAEMFLERMTLDIDNRRREAFIKELRKDPRFKPSMLEPAKPKFKTVTLDGTGPIIKTHKANRTGLETRKPFKWGPLGGYY